jgi:hypothetical protein
MSARSTTLVGTNVEHFEQLSRERDVLLKTSQQANRDREHALARLQELRTSKDAFNQGARCERDLGCRSS